MIIRVEYSIFRDTGVVVLRSDCEQTWNTRRVFWSSNGRAEDRRKLDICNYYEPHSPLRIDIGAVHKVRHARGGGVREGVAACDRGGGQEHVTSRL